MSDAEKVSVHRSWTWWRVQRGQRRGGVGGSTTATLEYTTRIVDDAGVRDGASYKMAADRMLLVASARPPQSYMVPG